MAYWRHMAADSGNKLLHDSTKPVTEPMLTNV